MSLHRLFRIIRHSLSLPRAISLASALFAALVLTAPAQAQTSAPTVSIQGSARLVVHPGESFSLTATASGSGAVSYRWYHNNRLVAGETGATLVKASATMADAGAYTVMATDSVGSRLSEAVFVLVAPVHTRVLSWGKSPSLQAVMVRGDRTVTTLGRGYFNAVAVEADGTVDAWEGVDPVTVGLRTVTDVVALSMGVEDALVLKADGTVTAFGANDKGQTTVPAGLAHVVAISAGYWHSLALKSDGTVVAWGDNTYGQCHVPAGLSNVVSVSASSTYSLALKADGTVVGWGNENAGATTSIAVSQVPPGDPSYGDAVVNSSNTATVPVTGLLNVPSTLNHVVAISACAYEALALLDDGTVYSWNAGLAGDGHVMSGLSGVTAISAGEYRSLALTSDGSAYLWGHDSSTSVAEALPIPKVAMIAGAAGSYVIVRDAGDDAIPSIYRQPQPATVTAGDKTTLTVDMARYYTAPFYAPGFTPLDFQWYRNGIAIKGAMYPSLDISPATEDDSGTYTVTVSSATGTVTSDPVKLTVIPLNHFIAVSTRCQVGTGENVAIQAFVLKKPTMVLVRAVGPTLSAFGVANALQHPYLKLFDGAGNKLVEVKGGSPAVLLPGGAAEPVTILPYPYPVPGPTLQDVTNAVHAFPLSSPDDIAFFVYLNAGVYTAQVTSADGASGTALLEVYDYRPTADNAAGDRITATSTRCQAGSAADAVLGLSLEHPAQVLLRAVGPTLGTFGVGAPLTKPRLTLMDATGRVVAANSGWQADVTQEGLLAATAAAVGDFPLTSAGDAALLVTLPGGQYTAWVESADGSTGVVLIEAYLVAPAK